MSRYRFIHYAAYPVNLGFQQGIPKLFEWALRKPNLNWSDRVKLWAITKHFDLPPKTVKLIVVALSRHRPGEQFIP